MDARTQCHHCHCVFATEDDLRQHLLRTHREQEGPIGHRETGPFAHNAPTPANGLSLETLWRELEAAYAARDQDRTIEIAISFLHNASERDVRLRPFIEPALELSRRPRTLARDRLLRDLCANARNDTPIDQRLADAADALRIEDPAHARQLLNFARQNGLNPSMAQEIATRINVHAECDTKPIGAYSDQTLDNKLEGIVGLRYLPWVGRQYLHMDDQYRVLVIAQSVYDWEPGTVISRELLLRHDFARVVVYDHRLDSRPDNPTKISRSYKNFERAIYRRRDISLAERKKLWLSAALHEYVQRPMRSKDDGPSDDDYRRSSRILKHTLEVIQPRLCIMWSTDWRAAQPMLNDYAQLDETRFYDTINGAQPRVLRCEFNSVRTKLLMIKQPGQRFSWDLWHDHFLRREAAEYIAYLVTS